MSLKGQKTSLYLQLITSAATAVVSDWSLGGTVSHLVSVQVNRLSVNNDVV